MRTDFIWSQLYRPKQIDDIILPENIKDKFKQFIDKGDIPNLLLSGSPGIGKTTVARAILEQLKCDYIVINGSLNGNIDTLRNDIMQFASCVSFQGGRKYVIIDECEYLNAQSTQPALRNFMEEYSKNCGFILTCNFKNRIIEPLRSRCSVIEFKIDKEDNVEIKTQFYKRVKFILDDQNIKYESKPVALLIDKYFPDFRRTINELQLATVNGVVDSSILSNTSDQAFKQLIGFMKDKNFTHVRKWVVENQSDDIFRKFYDNAVDILTSDSIPQLVLILAEYQYKSAFVVDQEINISSMFAEMMVSLTFKE